MRDQVGRSIDYLRLSLTAKCDLRCRYCQPEARLANISELDLADFLFFVQVAASLGISRVRLTGGEPLLKPGIVDFIGELAGVPGIKDIALTTNGTLLAGLALPLWRKGLKRVNISLDSLNPERYAYMTRGGELHRVMAGVYAALDSGLYPVKLNCVVIRGFNDDEVEAFADLTRHQDVAVRFIELMSFGEGTNFPATALVTMRELMDTLGPLEAAVQESAGPAKVFRLPGALGTIGFISGTSEYFCGGCNRLRVTAQGCVRPCLFADVEVDVAELIVTRQFGALQSALQLAVANKPRRELSIDNRRMAEIGG
ncbi:MAG: GTP 3',8-cyclase 1 [Firmicutes bacterium]|nr:GTP 3',8-cyclase 1 [Bacillota bacterium]